MSQLWIYRLTIGSARWRRPVMRPGPCLLTLLSVAICCAHADGQRLSITHATLSDDAAAFDVSFEAQGQSNTSAIQWSLIYSPQEIQAFTVTPGPVATKADKALTCEPQGDRYICVLAGMNATRIDDGVVAVIRAALVPRARSIDITLANAVAASSDGSMIPVASGNGVALGSAAVSSLTCMSSVAVTPVSVSCEVTIASPPPREGAQVLITTSGPINAPASVRVAAGVSSAEFLVASPVLKNPARAKLAVAYGGASLETSMLLLEPIHISALECTPSRIAAGEHVNCVVMLNRAPASSTVIELSADTPGLGFPDSITVPANVRRWKFPITADDRVSTSGDVVFAAHTSSPSQYSTESVLLRLTGEPVLRGFGSLKPRSTHDFAPHSDQDQVRPGDKCPCSLWAGGATPAVGSTPDDRPVEVGVRFRSSTNGYITAIRFYKGHGNRGPHTGHVWTAAGHLLASVSFNRETASGWQVARLERPVHIRAGTPYVVSYYAPHGQYASTHGFFRPPMRSGGVLYAPLDGAGGGNGIFHYGSQQFPTDSYESTNYWVDVVISNDTAVP